MGIIIKATGSCDDPELNSSVLRAGAAGNAALKKAELDGAEIDLLINVGIYRDHNMVEPAMAALIQKEVGMNLDYVKFPTEKAGASFDLMNGATGVLNAVQVASAFILGGGATHVLIVSGDGHPSREQNKDFPFACVGSAMLLGKSEDSEVGFGPVQTRKSEGDSMGLEGFAKSSATEAHGRNNVSVLRDDNYEKDLVEFSARCAQDYLEAQELDLNNTLLITSQVLPEYASRLGAELGVDRKWVTLLKDVDGDPHTSALTLGYEQALTEGLVDECEKILFLAAGSGLSCVCAVYSPPR